MDLSVKIGRLILKNPVMVASGTFGYAEEYEGLINLKRLGAIVTKTITLKPRTGNPPPRICETYQGMLNAIGLQNEGIENFLNKKPPYLRKLKTPIIVSISGDSIEEFKELARRLDKASGVDGIELNLSCPNIEVGSWKLEAGRLIAQDKDATYKVVKIVRKYTDKTIITKLTPNVTDIVEIAQAASKAGTDGVSLINTFLGMAIDINTRRPRLGNITGGLSGPCIKPIALRMVWEVAENIDKPVIGMGGIFSAEDAIEFFIAGATCVAVGTANFVEPDISEKIIDGIENYLRRNKLKNIKEIIGSLDER